MNRNTYMGVNLTSAYVNLPADYPILPGSTGRACASQEVVGAAESDPIQTSARSGSPDLQSAPAVSFRL
jgi:hypothetical protein